MPPIIVTFPSPADPTFDVTRFYAAMTARGVLIYPGKLAMVGSFRIGCITRIDPERMSRGVVAVEETRQKLGGRSAAVSGVSAPFMPRFFRRCRSPRGRRGRSPALHSSE
ncbi:hypothetical protein ACTTAF_17435 [Rhodobacter capsulatus]|uniref:hypothetical protein n=1 Tax=Rhodobacter capsulatus TaxID=1061 RepID=UPI00104009A2|nr:hypothetical protein [Rhodobacter capsulatus]